MLDDAWLNEFWINLGQTNRSIRVQVHTHPLVAFHSYTDDEYPIIRKAGFLSLVIPNFGMASVSFQDAYLAEVQEDGTWAEIAIQTRLLLT